MAKTDVFEADLKAKAVELKRLLKMMADDDYSADSIDEVIEKLRLFKDMKMMKKSSSSSFVLHETIETVSVSCPEEFKCPISKQLMRDPVVISSGQTYDRAFIEKWLKGGNKTCPQTQQVLSHTMVTPNHLIHDMILKWCKSKGIEPPNPNLHSNEDTTREADQNHFHTLLEQMSSTLSDQKEAAKKLRSLTKRTPSFRAFFGESPNSIPMLLTPLVTKQTKIEFHHDLDRDLQEDIITTLLNISIHDNNKKLVAETPNVVPLLIESVKSGNIQTRSNAAATLFTLSALDSNKTLIGKSGALKPLIELLEEGHPLAMNDVASAIFNLCIAHENKGRAVRDGAVRVIVKKITEHTLVDELLAILAMISTNERAVDELGQFEGIPCLFKIIKDCFCDRNKENCIAILYTICLYDRTKWKEMREEEKVYGTISKLAQNGTSRAKRKANGILERLNRPVYITHTA